MVGGRGGTLGGAAEMLIARGDLDARVGELASQIASDRDHRSDPLLLIGVLKGSTLFLADLMRALHMEVAVDFMSISSYQEGVVQSGVVRIVKDLDEDIVGRDVLIVEDIVDTGLTLNYLRRTLSERRPRSLRAVTLLDKSARRIVPVELEFSGFEIPDVFVVGYGLDFQGRYRNVPDILAVTDLGRLINDPLLLVGDVFTSRA